VESPTAVPLLCALVWYYTCVRVCVCVCEAGRGSGGSRIAIAFLEVSMYRYRVKKSRVVFVDDWNLNNNERCARGASLIVGTLG